ncbi:MAG: phosphoglycolate phosphatase [Proteobacteria bacterium]|nr:phosphoglycolate phosphatase [Pseudomonadota bacterium]
MRPTGAHPARPVLLFDLDGTLIDSAPDLAASLNHLLAGLGRGALALPAVTAMVGDGAAKLVERGLAATGGPPAAGPGLAELVARFLAHYERHATVLTRPFPGVAATLAGLAAAGYRAGVCTNKPERATRTILAGLGLARFFAAVGGGDSFPVKKPDPGHVTALLGLLDARPAEAVMVGDSANDVAAARAAGLPVVAVSYGYTPLPAATLGADAVIERFADLPAALARLP